MEITSKWYVIQEVYINGSYRIVVVEGVQVGPINGRFFQFYYP